VNAEGNKVLGLITSIEVYEWNASRARGARVRNGWTVESDIVSTRHAHRMRKVISILMREKISMKNTKVVTFFLHFFLSQFSLYPLLIVSFLLQEVLFHSKINKLPIYFYLSFRHDGKHGRFRRFLSCRNRADSREGGWERNNKTRRERRQATSAIWANTLTLTLT